MSFDLNLARAAVTLLSFAAFLGIVWWAMSRRNQSGFDEAALLPFLEDGSPVPATARTTSAASLER